MRTEIIVKKCSHHKKLQFILKGMPGSPLVVHSFSEKAKKEIRDKQQKKGKLAKEARNPQEEFESAKYIDGDGDESVPVMALKKALVTAATSMKDLTKVALRQALFVEPTENAASWLVKIKNANEEKAKGIMREDAVTIGINTRGLCYRPEYGEWVLDVTVQYHSGLVSKDQLIALMQQAGWGVGLFEGRPEKTSALGWGRFEIAHVYEVDL